MSSVSAEFEVVRNFGNFFLVLNFILSLLVLVFLKHNFLVFSGQPFLVTL